MRGQAAWGLGRGALRVLVVGGSLGGLNAALWLRDAGCDVEVLERSRAPLQGRGAGIVLHPATVRYLLERARVDVGALSAPAHRLRYLAPDGAVAAERPCRFRFTSYTALYRGFLNHLEDRRYHLGRDAVELEQGADGVAVRFADGSGAEGDLLVGADGVNSAVRRLLLPEVAGRYAGYVAWRGTVAEAQLGGPAFAGLSAAITYHLRGDGHLLVYPIPGEEGDGRGERGLVNWLWYRNVPDGPELEDLLTGKEGVRFGSSLPPGLVRDEHLARLRGDAAALPPALAELVAATGGPFLQVVSDLAVPRMAIGRAVLLGDAAFALRPHVAARSAKAAEDGRTLAAAVAGQDGDLGVALGRWEAAQLELGRRAL
ncbi:MAG: FAD-dependent monooxygenase, partial [Actinomycetota bacterium]|nr:FAD-dependent monooxygenase [Actinomycetota bacterium]